MSVLAHAPGTDVLPGVLPIFPLPGVLLLPRGHLPLNIFEPRYLAMIRDAMAGDHVIGMVQPIDPRSEGEIQPEVYKTGCAGRITSFEETDDGRFLIELTGLCRFAVVDELPLDKAGYRRVQATYDAFSRDMGDADERAIDRTALLRALQACFDTDDDSAVDWASIEHTPSETLIVSLAMMLPFGPSEKQALLEARDLGERSAVLTALMEMMAAQDQTGGEGMDIQ